jgi:hypothetical protein
MAKTVNEFLKECGELFKDFTFVAKSNEGLEVKGRCENGQIKIIERKPA